MTNTPSDEALDDLVARFSSDQSLDDALVRSLALDRALRHAWLDAFKRRIAAQLRAAKQARDAGDARATELDARLAIEKDALRALVQRVDGELRATAPMPCLKVRAPRSDDDD